MDAYFTSREAARLVDLAPHRIRAIARLGVVGRRTATSEQNFTKTHRRYYTFADLTLLRTVRKVLAQGLALSRVMRALLFLRGKHVRPPSTLITSIIALEDGRLLAREGDLLWDVQSKQALLFPPPQMASSSQPLSQLITLPRVLNAPSEDISSSAQNPLNAPKGGIKEADRYFDQARACEEARPGEAYRLYARALLCDPEHIESLVNLGCLHLTYDDLVRAQSYFRVALSLDAGHSIAHYHLGLVATRRGETQAAIQCFRVALLYRPNYADARRALKEALAQQL